MRLWPNPTILAVVLSVGAGTLASPPTQMDAGRIRCTADTDCPSDTQKCLPTSPPGTKACFAGLRPPPPAQLASAVALGRTGAAADLTWVRTMQFIGAPYSEAVQYEGLEDWGALTLELRPDITEAALTVGSLLANLPRKAEAAERILARADEVPHVRVEHKRMISFWRAATAYYGLLDAKRAADFYEEAYERGAGPLMKARATSLRKSESSCAALATAFQQDLESATTQGGVALNANQANISLGEIMYNCFSQRIRGAEAAAQIATQRTDFSIDELVEAGYLKEPPTAPPGQHWVLENRIPKLLPQASGDP